MRVATLCLLAITQLAACAYPLPGYKFPASQGVYAPPVDTERVVVYDDKGDIEREYYRLSVEVVTGGTIVKEPVFRKKLQAVAARHGADFVAIIHFGLMNTSELNELGYNFPEGAIPMSYPVMLGLAGRYATATLGVATHPTTHQITRIEKGSPVSRAGLKIGDRLDAIDGENFSSDEYERKVLRRRPGTEVTIDWTTTKGIHKTTTIELADAI